MYLSLNDSRVKKQLPVYPESGMSCPRAKEVIHINLNMNGKASRSTYTPHKDYGSISLLTIRSE
jgi:hypothetical protein